MAVGGLGLAERRSRFRAAQEALAGLAEVLHEASGAELAELVGELDAVVAQGGAARMVAVTEAVRRGVVAESG